MAKFHQTWFHSPKHTPAMSAMLDDIGRPAPAALAALLDVHERTVYTWLAKDDAPRPVKLALFYETQWGRDLVNCAAVNDARMLATEVSILRAENDRLKGRVAYLECVGQFDSANAPTFTPSPFWPPRLEPVQLRQRS